MSLFFRTSIPPTPPCCGDVQPPSAALAKNALGGIYFRTSPIGKLNRGCQNVRSSGPFFFSEYPQALQRCVGVFVDVLHRFQTLNDGGFLCATNCATTAKRAADMALRCLRKVKLAEHRRKYKRDYPKPVRMPRFPR